MAIVALPSLRPNFPVTNVSITVVGAATGWEAIDDDPDSPNLADYVYDAGTTSGDLIVGLTDMPVDFQNMQSPVTVRASTQAVGFADDSDTLTVELTAADGTLLSNTVTLSTQAHTATALRTATLTLNAAGLAANQATWNDARLHMLWTYAASMAKDNGVIRVYALEVDGSYNQLPPPENAIFSVPTRATTTGFGAVGFRQDTFPAGPTHATAAAFPVPATFYGQTVTPATRVTTTTFGPSLAGSSTRVTVAAAHATAAAFGEAVVKGALTPPPTNVVATAISATEVEVTWDAVPLVGAYDIERNGSVIALDVVGTSFTDLGVVAETAYTYRVRSVL